MLSFVRPLPVSKLAFRVQETYHISALGPGCSFWGCVGWHAVGEEWQSLCRKREKKVVSVPEREEDGGLSVGLSGEGVALNEWPKIISCLDTGSFLFWRSWISPAQGSAVWLTVTPLFPDRLFFLILSWVKNTRHRPYWPLATWVQVTITIPCLHGSLSINTCIYPLNKQTWFVFSTSKNSFSRAGLGQPCRKPQLTLMQIQKGGELGLEWSSFSGARIQGLHTCVWVKDTVYGKSPE